MKCIINGRLILPDSVVSGMAILFDDKIRAICPQEGVDLTAYEVIDAAGAYVAPAWWIFTSTAIWARMYRTAAWTASRKWPPALRRTVSPPGAPPP